MVPQHLVDELGRLSNSRLMKEDPEAFLQLSIAESDRAVIIMFVSALEDALQDKLAEAMPNADRRDLSKGALQSMDAKIRFAHWLKLISKDDRDLLHNLRLVRNQAAHAQVEITFLTAQISDVLEHLLDDMFLPKWQRGHPLGRRAIFGLTCFSLVWRLTGQQPVDPNRFYTEVVFSWARAKP